jgi:hypothetical protein
VAGNTLNVMAIGPVYPVRQNPFLHPASSDPALTGSALPSAYDSYELGSFGTLTLKPMSMHGTHKKGGPRLGAALGRGASADKITRL